MSSPIQRFDDFRNAVAKHFAPVAVHFSLGPAVERLLYPDFFVEFSRGPTRLEIAYELGSPPPWVSVVVPTIAGHERHFGLHAIVRHRVGNQKAFGGIGQLSSLDEQVRLLASLTMEHGGALLERKPIHLRELYLLEHETFRKAQRADDVKYGYVRPHPKLEEIFAAAPTRAFFPVCAYHAVVDYDYGVEKVAAFLNTTADDVRGMLERHDTVG